MDTAQEEVKVFKPQPKQELFLGSKADVVIYGGAAGSGKASRINELAPTPSGWKQLGDIQDGDQLFDENGAICTVIKAHDSFVPERCYQLIFDDGSTIDCCADHLWLTYTAKDLAKITRRDPDWQARRRAKRPSRVAGNKSELFTQRLRERNAKRAIEKRSELLSAPTGSVKTTQEIADTLTVRNGSRANHAIPVCKAWKLPEVYLQIPPYTLGAWLGDGNTNGQGFTGADLEIINEIRKDGFIVNKRKYRYSWGIIGLNRLLKVYGFVGHKHIPSIYLRASFEQRLSLLQGLMDTDGHATKSGSTCEYTTTLRELADNVFELAISLGLKATLREKRAKLKGQDYGPCYTIAFSTDLPVFRLPRKLERLQRRTQRPVNQFRYIVGCEPIDPVPMRCLTVDSPSRLYLVGKTGIPTHNTFALLLEPLRHINNPEFGGIIFRREAKMITMEGGLRDEAMKIYPYFGGEYRSQPRVYFKFPSGSRISFDHLNQEEDVYSYQGAQIPFIGWDELDHYTKKQFIYMMSRNRSTCGINPYMRCTVNANATSWVAEVIAWWIDQRDTLPDGSQNPHYGLPIEERSGVIRYFAIEDERWLWGDTPEEVIAQGASADQIKTLTFVPAKVWDNPALIEKDPGYIANLKAQSRVERARLLDGNWKIKSSAGLYFPRYDVTLLNAIPTDVVTWVRAWDLAASEVNPGCDPDWTVGVKVGKRANGTYVISDVVRTRRKSSDVRTLLKRTALQDGPACIIDLPQDPGQAGKAQVQSLIAMLQGYTVQTHQSTRANNRLLRAEPIASQWQVGNIEVVKSFWNNEFFDELDQFPDPNVHDDQVDAMVSGVIALLNRSAQVAASIAKRNTYG